MSLKSSSIAVFCLLLVPATRCAGDLIVNGSFETPVVAVGGFTNFAGGSTAVTGWTVVGVDSSVISGSFTQSGIVFQAQSGVQWIDMAGVTSNSPTSGVRQIVPTQAGQSYELAFHVGSATGGSIFFPATVDLSIDGGGRTSYFNPSGPSNMLNWMPFTVQFTAISASTSLTFFNGSAANNFLSALDSVSMNAIPEPSITGLMLSALAGIGLVRRRRC